jgi:hypothetical protein
MFQLNIYQKDKLLNQIMMTYEDLLQKNDRSNLKYVFSMYEKIQRMNYGESLGIKDSVKLAKLIEKATSKKRRPCPNKGGACASRGRN